MRTMLWVGEVQRPMHSLWRTQISPTNALCHTYYGSDNRGRTRIRHFWVWGRQGTDTAIIGSRIHREVWICEFRGWSRPVQRQGGWRDSLPTLPSGNCGVTFTKDEISILHHEGIVVVDNDENAPDNILNSEYVPPDPKIINLGFRGIDTWHQIGKLPVGKAWIKMVSNIRFQHMSRFEIFFHL